MKSKKSEKHIKHIMKTYEIGRIYSNTQSVLQIIKSNSRCQECYKNFRFNNLHVRDEIPNDEDPIKQIQVSSKIFIILKL